MTQGIPPRSQVRETGRMTDLHGFTVVLGVDHDAVTITAGSVTIVPAADDRDDEFTRLYFQAVKAAQAQAGTECHGACCMGAGTDEALDALAERAYEQQYRPGVSDPAGSNR